MSFRLSVTLQGCEFRARSSRTAVRDGNTVTYHSVRVELDEEPMELSVRDDAVWESCLTLRKGEFYDFPIVAVATNDYNFIQVTDKPVPFLGGSSSDDVAGY